MPVRLCIVYDCLYPYTIGGAERWYRGLAERAVGDGLEVTYLTRRQWRTGGEPSVVGVRVVAVSPSAELYTEEGRRRTTPPLAFGAGVLRHLLAHGSAYDVVHTASFPYFSVLATAAARHRHAFRLFVDWHEVWTREYWRSYLGPLGGRAGWLVQRACLRVPQRAYCFSRLHERRLLDSGLAHVTRLEGQYPGTAERNVPAAAEPTVIFAGRLVPEKNVTALVAAVARARERIPDVRLAIYGNGPERERIHRSVGTHGLAAAVTMPGFVERATLDLALAQALCLVLPSRREGYGLVVVEASARGVPVVVARGRDNAAVELVEDGVNGMVARSAAPDDLADAIVRVDAAGVALRVSTADWFERNAGRLSLESSLERVLDGYARA
jgi:glycosyltransferase involved in cell wall biosynthesis